MQSPSRQKKQDMGAAGWAETVETDRESEMERAREGEREREDRTAESVGKGKVGKRESNGQRVERLFLTCSPWKRDVSLCQFAPLTSL